MRTEAHVQDAVRLEEAGPQRGDALEAELASLRADNDCLRADVGTLRADNEALRATLKSLRTRYHAILEELHLLKRRLHVAKAERLEDVESAQLAFDTLLAEANALAKVIETAETIEQASNGASPAEGAAGPTEPAAPAAQPKDRPKPKGRRNLADMDLPTVWVDLTDAALEETSERIGTTTSEKLAYQRGGYRKLVIERAVYKSDGSEKSTPSSPTSEASPEPHVADAACADVADVPAADVRDAAAVAGAPAAPATGPAPASAASPPVEVFVAHVPATEVVLDEIAAPPASAESERAGGAQASPKRTFRIVRVPAPLEIVKGGMLAPSMIAHLLVTKYLMGVPFYRYEQQCARDGIPLDRSTMCRYAEHVGATLGCIVEAARKEAIATAFCLATDATGVAIQPERLPDRKRQPCKKAHFFVTLADKDHVFLDYQPKHTSLTVWEMFKGFSGYIQADAHAIYDALFAGRPPEGADETEPLGSPPKEVGCLAHARRKHWEAAACKYPLGLEGLRLVNAIFEADRPFAKLPPSERKARRDESVRPVVDAYFAWVKLHYAKVTERGLVRTALGYSVRHEAALRRFLDDGRLRLDNNPSESALRGTIATGRKAWLFYGSDDHASAAGNIFSLIASCKLHSLDPEAYLAEVIRILPYWPRDRYLELAPKYWRETRARVPDREWELPIGPITVPPPRAREKPASN